MTRTPDQMRADAEEVLTNPAGYIGATRRLASDVLSRLAERERPIDMVLFCPSCSQQHIDKPEPERKWTNPPHRSHLCSGCCHIWRPSDYATNGVSKIDTKGGADSAIVNPQWIANDALEREAQWHDEEGEKAFNFGAHIIAAVHAESACHARSLKSDPARPPSPPGTAPRCPVCGSTDGEGCDQEPCGNKSRPEPSHG